MKNEGKKLSFFFFFNNISSRKSKTLIICEHVRVPQMKLIVFMEIGKGKKNSTSLDKIKII